LESDKAARARRTLKGSRVRLFPTSNGAGANWEIARRRDRCSRRRRRMQPKEAEHLKIAHACQNGAGTGETRMPASSPWGHVGARARAGRLRG
jgi:hypothetical protein